MLKVETGKTVKINYTGKFENGDVFDTSLVEGREPLRTMLGQGNLIPGFEKGLMWVKPYQIAKGIISSIDRRECVVYTPGFWFFIMVFIRLIPNWIFNKV